MGKSCNLTQNYFLFLWTTLNSMFLELYTALVISNKNNEENEKVKKVEMVEMEKVSSVSFKKAKRTLMTAWWSPD